MIVPMTPTPRTADGNYYVLEIAPGLQAGPVNGAGIESLDMYGFGTFSVTMKTGEPGLKTRHAGVVTSFFLYRNTGDDATNDGLSDNAEIDFEWLLAEPSTVYLTLWTDYDDKSQRHKRVCRKIDIRTGTICYTNYFERFDEGTPLYGEENQPDSLAAISDYDSSAEFYTYSIERKADSVSWYMQKPGNIDRILLWRYSGRPDRLCTGPVQIMANIWHTDTWTPANQPDAKKPPAGTVQAYYSDFFYTPSE